MSVPALVQIGAVAAKLCARGGLRHAFVRNFWQFLRDWGFTFAVFRGILVHRLENWRDGVCLWGGFVW